MKAEMPHIAKIKFNIFIHELTNDGMIDPFVIDCSEEFDKIGASDECEITVVGLHKCDCITKVKKILEEIMSHNG